MPLRKTTDIVQLKVRLREDLRRQLDREAKKRQHSLNTEIVNRLEQSLLLPQSIDEMLGGGHVASLLRLIANAVRVIERRHQSQWDRDPKVQRTVLMAVWGILTVGATNPMSFEQAPGNLPTEVLDQALAAFVDRLEKANA